MDVRSRFGADVSFPETKIDYIGLIALLALPDHNVLRFQISVHKLLLMNEFELVQNLDADIGCCRDRELTIAESE